MDFGYNLLNCSFGKVDSSDRSFLTRAAEADNGNLMAEPHLDRVEDDMDNCSWLN